MSLAEDHARARGTHYRQRRRHIRHSAGCEQPCGDRAGTARSAERAADEHRSACAQLLDSLARRGRGPRRPGGTRSRTGIATSSATAACNSNSAVRSTTPAAGEPRKFARGRHSAQVHAVGDCHRLRVAPTSTRAN